MILENIINYFSYDLFLFLKKQKGLFYKLLQLIKILICQMCNLFNNVEKLNHMLVLKKPPEKVVFVDVVLFNNLDY